MTPEGKIQKKIISYLKDSGYFVTKLMQTSTNGIPDVLAVSGHTTIFVEVKTETGKLSELQKTIISDLRRKKQKVIVCFGYEDFVDKYSNLFLMRECDAYEYLDELLEQKQQTDLF